MIRLVSVLLVILFVLGCQPSTRYSGAPPNPRTAGGLGYPEPEEDYGPRVEESAVEQSRLDKIIRSYLGVKYRLGGSGKLGMDCSGLVYAVYRDYNNTHLPPNTRKLYGQLPRVKYRELTFGDLVFFSLQGKHVSHVGIYIGDGRFVHASRSRGVVISSLDESYYRESYAGACRVVG